MIKTLIKNSKYIFCAQLTNCLLGFLLSFILPKVLGVEQFGYWQIYVFYTTYVGFMHFGYNDGIYLRYGNYEYSQLPQSKFRIQFRMLGVMELLFTVISSILLISLSSETTRLFSYLFASWNIFILGLNTFFLMVNQVTNRFKYYSSAIMLEKISFSIVLVILILLKKHDFRYFVVSDAIIKTAVLLYNIFVSREIIWGKLEPIKDNLADFWENINVGSKLMFANIMGMLLLGLGRFIIERFYTVADFGLYSFAINCISLVLIFVQSVSLALYPILCRLPQENLPRYYNVITIVLSSAAIIGLLTYYPLSWIINYYLPNFTPVLDYLYLLFPIIIMQVKMQLLINNYYKSLRKEKALFSANFSAVVLFVIIICIALALNYKSIQLIVWVTMIVITWRCFVSDLYLRKLLGLKQELLIYYELIMIGLFIVAIGYIKGILGFGIYAAAIGLFIFVNFSHIKESLIKLINLFKRKEI